MINFKEERLKNVALYKLRIKEWESDWKLFNSSYFEYFLLTFENTPCKRKHFEISMNILKSIPELWAISE